VLQGHNSPSENFSVFRILISPLPDKFPSIFSTKVQTLQILVGFQYEIYTEIGP